MTKKHTLLFLILIVTFTTYAQSTLLDVLDPTRSNNTSLLSKEGKPVEGNPNLFEEHKIGTLYYGKSGASSTALMNLDLYNKKLLVNFENDTYTVSPANLQKVKIQVAYDSVAEFKYVNSNLAQVLYEDSTHAVYINHSVKIKKGSPGNGYQENKNDSFESTHTYELIKPFALTFSDSKDLIKKVSKMDGTKKEKINSLGKLKGEDKNSIIQIVKIL